MRLFEMLRVMYNVPSMYVSLKLLYEKNCMPVQWPVAVSHSDRVRRAVHTRLRTLARRAVVQSTEQNNACTYAQQGDKFTFKISICRCSLCYDYVDAASAHGNP